MGGKKKTTLLVKVVAVMLIGMMALTGCGKSAGQAELTNHYITAAPSFDKAGSMVTLHTEGLDIYSDNTYAFEFTAASFWLNDNIENAIGSMMGNYKITFYGTYTAQSEEGITSYVLSDSTRTKIEAIQHGIDVTWDSAKDKFAQVGGGDSEASTEKLLEVFTMQGQTVSANDADYTFPYVANIVKGMDGIQTLDLFSFFTLWTSCNPEKAE